MNFQFPEVPLSISTNKKHKRMKSIVIRIVVAICLIASSASAFAWSGPGHMIVAAWAYKELTPAEQQKLDAILQKHPRFGRWRQDFPQNVPGLTMNLYAVMAASLYPDQIRDHNNPATFPNWHFVDYPLRPPSFPFQGAPTPQDDVLFGIARSEAVIKSTNSTEADRAVMASFLIHLVGDVHQPLHCATLFNQDFHPPEGDRGGNNVFVRATAGGSAIKLHSFWDGQFGTGQVADHGHVRPALNKAIALRAAFPRSGLPELTQHASPKSWSLESRFHAVNDTYLSGNLQYGTTAATAKTLPAGYSSKAKQLCEHRIALAAYRLADRLKRDLR